ncbi:nucleoside-diphosphate sugar epimerase [Photobacterium jeanii]|uniref:Nucleoside-diphosphate sugar epimerase n=1 Tax=Photobacterium jeanii TaxID=858640 RepID=A0A178KA54_9GAMM|nr:NAD(P)H-binding protein [Photobacterium jeanii]OAN13594.1 nucleoside-diphosphate sugar epimerase [Photobacterium jeanii]PST88712.1 nucleoside-diphosphate sugar epimerase [Photobacterium jeanii]
MTQNTTQAVIAGASGLVGDELLHQLLAHDEIRTVYSLSRRELPFHSKKLVQIVHPELRVTEWSDQQATPQLGFICLGTTLKQAGSKAALKAVDYDLVKDVATTMKMIGVQHIIVISSLFAHPLSPSHYLRCKGKMEKAIKAMGFEHCTFVRPGPLKGERSKPRRDEVLTQGILQALQPLLIGPLAHFTPIPAEHLAKVMLEQALQPLSHSPSANTIVGKDLLA